MSQQCCILAFGKTIIFAILKTQKQPKNLK